MTKKDYTLIAEAIRQAKADIDPADDTVITTIGHVARRIAMAIDHDLRGNPRFDRRKFLKAAGFDNQA